MSEDEEEWEEEEEWDDEPEEEAPSGDFLRSLSLALIAMVPLVLAYEWALSQGSPSRNAAEVLLGRGLSLFGEYADLARRLVWVALVAGAWMWNRVRRRSVGPGVARIVLEGLVAAVLLGPLLIGMMEFAGEWAAALDVSWDVEGPAPRLEEAALLAGGAVWEELLFRVGLYSILYLLVRRGLLLVGSSMTVARIAAELVGLLGSALAFSLFHFHKFRQYVLVGGGREFEADAFVWILCAGLVLGVLFRWRGPGVAAWAHGLFNLTLLLGIDPDVLQ